MSKKQQAQVVVRIHNDRRTQATWMSLNVRLLTPLHSGGIFCNRLVMLSGCLNCREKMDWLGLLTVNIVAFPALHNEPE